MRLFDEDLFAVDDIDAVAWVLYLTALKVVDLGVGRWLLGVGGYLFNTCGIVDAAKAFADTCVGVLAVVVEVPVTNRFATAPST